MNPAVFKKTIWKYYATSRRSFPWREHIDPYHVVVSEVMLQQTQAPRVIPKFESFIKKFPDWRTLAEASLSDVLKEWQGLGYNRRGVSMKKLAQMIMEKHDGEPPPHARDTDRSPEHRTEHRRLHPRFRF